MCPFVIQKPVTNIIPEHLPPHSLQQHPMLQHHGDTSATSSIEALPTHTNNDTLGGLSGDGDVQAIKIQSAPSDITADAKSTTYSPGRQHTGKSDKPKRPLSAYNIFFKEERARLVEELEQKLKEAEDQHGEGISVSQDGPHHEIYNRENTSSDVIKRRKKRPHRIISFQDMAKIIADRWKNVEPERLQEYEARAETDKQRYLKDRQDYQQKIFDERIGLLELTVSDETRKQYLTGDEPKSRRRRHSSS